MVFSMVSSVLDLTTGVKWALHDRLPRLGTACVTRRLRAAGSVLQATMLGSMIDSLFSAAHLRPQYQPIVDLLTGETVGYEALARWPSVGASPVEAFAEAAHAGRLAELDHACQLESLRGALDNDIDPSLTLFVNGEPSSFAHHPASPLGAMIARSAGRLRVVMEVTERRLLEDPAALFRAIRRIRDRGWGIALDDVGAVPASLAMLPFIAPDVIKLDISLVQQWPTAAQGGIVTAVMAYAERTGATVLAEGIETPDHLEQALALGATLGQGWYYAAAQPLPPTKPTDRPVPFLARTNVAATSPFQLIADGPLRVGRKGLLLGISRHLENQGMVMETAPVVLANFQSSEHFTPATARRYAALARRCPLVSAVGRGLSSSPVPGVFGASLRNDDPLRGEWTVVVVGPHYAGALIAHDLGDSGPDRERRFAFTVTHRRDIVLAAALSVFERLEPQRPSHAIPVADPTLPPVLVAPTSWIPPVATAR